MAAWPLGRLAAWPLLALVATSVTPANAEIVKWTEGFFGLEIIGPHSGIPAQWRLIDPQGDPYGVTGLNRLNTADISVNGVAFEVLNQAGFTKDEERRQQTALRTWDRAQVGYFNCLAQFSEWDPSRDKLPDDNTRLKGSNVDVYCRVQDWPCQDPDDLRPFFFWNDFEMLKWLNDSQGGNRFAPWFPVATFATSETQSNRAFSSRKDPNDSNPDKRRTNINWFLNRFPDVFWDPWRETDYFAERCDLMAQLLFDEDSNPPTGHREQGLKTRPEIIGNCIGNELFWFDSNEAFPNNPSSPWNGREWLRWLILGWQPQEGVAPCDGKDKGEPTPGKRAFVAAMKQKYQESPSACVAGGNPECPQWPPAICDWNLTYGPDFCITSWDDEGDDTSLLKSFTIWDLVAAQNEAGADPPREAFCYPDEPFSVDLLEENQERLIHDPLRELQPGADPIDFGTKLTDDDAAYFMHIVADTFYTKVTNAINEHDDQNGDGVADHLIISDRFVATSNNIQEYMSIASRYVDVLAVNLYVDTDKLNHNKVRLRSLYNNLEFRRPILITEFTYHNDHWGTNPLEETPYEKGWDRCWPHLMPNQRCNSCPNAGNLVCTESSFLYSEIGTDNEAESNTKRAQAYADYIATMAAAKGTSPASNPAPEEVARFIVGFMWHASYDHMFNKRGGIRSEPVAFWEDDKGTQNWGIWQTADSSPSLSKPALVDEYTPLWGTAGYVNCIFQANIAGQTCNQ